MNGYVATTTYHYILELGDTGKIIGGRYCTDSVEDHPDFLWTVTRVSPSSYGRNPNVSLSFVQQLIGLSIDTGTTPPGGTTKNFENTAGAAIPDNSTTGATVAINVPDTFTFKTLAVSVDIEHTWQGDLKVELLKNGTSVATLHDKTGGSADNVTTTTSLTPAQAGGDAGKATWSLRVTDSAAQDTGSIKLFKLSFTL